MKNIAPAPSEYGKVRILRKYIDIDKLLLYTSILTASILLFLSVILGIYKAEKIFATIILLSFIIITIPYTIYKYLKLKILERILDYYPIFLRDLADATLSGLSLIRALKIIANSDYGPLTPFIRKLAIWVDWGIPFDKAFMKFSQYFKDLPIIQKVNRIILESYKTGGDIAKVLLSVADSMEELRALDKERSTYLSQQVAVLYVIYFIFAVVIVIIIHSLGPLVLTQTAASKNVFNFIQVGTVDIDFLKNVSALALIVEAISIAFVIGLAISASKLALFRHLAILLTAATLIAVFVILPEKISFTVYVTPVIAYPGESIKIYGSILIDSKPPQEPLLITIKLGNTEYRVYTDVSGYYEITAKAPPVRGEYKITAQTYYKGKKYTATTELKVQ